MVEVIRTQAFIRWLSALRDPRARDRIEARIDRLNLGNPGDVRSVGGGISEMRIHYGPGYRIYFTWRGNPCVILLCGGDKQSQNADIDRARQIARLIRP